MGTRNIIVALNSFGADEVKYQGQLWYARVAEEAGADGVEIRGELLTGGAAELDAIARELPIGFVPFYSEPNLWTDQGTLDLDKLDGGLAAAERLGAKCFKTTLGGYASADVGSIGDAMAALRERLDATSIELLVENDQSERAGTITMISDFLYATRRSGIRIPFVFDLGNWHWTNEDPSDAASMFALHRGDEDLATVGYVHLKGVQRQPVKLEQGEEHDGPIQPQQWMAVPLMRSQFAWRPVLRKVAGLTDSDTPWAIEYPLIAGNRDDLVAVTREQVGLMWRLSQTRL